MAIKLARRAIRIRHNTRPAWLLLSRCYVRHGLYGLSLVALNVVPAPPLPGQEMVSGAAGNALMDFQAAKLLKSQCLPQR
jgi:hypothetical protein